MQTAAVSAHCSSDSSCILKLVTYKEYHDSIDVSAKVAEEAQREVVLVVQ